LHTVRTYRSSASNPNSQNIPKRDDTAAKLVRRCFIPRKDHVLVEVDYSGHEFRIAGCFWRDDAMCTYAGDPKLDIHRDMAAECYDCDVDQVSGKMRFYAKNQFVFPTLYGSYFVNTTRNLRKPVHELSLKDGTPLRDWLRDRGLNRADAYEDHVRGVEESFMGKFPQFAKRRDQWWDRYQKRGWFRMMTGFIATGVMSRNDVYNYPVQGPAFHCLLWSLIEIVRWLRKNRMRSKVVGQIHDSIIADVHRDELDDYLATAKRIMTEDIRNEWNWLVVPLEVEAEVGERNWWEKKEVSV
jgi:DNA polymerase-1